MYLPETKKLQYIIYLHTRDQSIIELMILRMLQHHYEPTLPLASSGPTTYKLAVSASSSPSTIAATATAAIVAIVAITGLVVAWCRLIPSSSSPLSSTAAATPPTTASPPPHLVLLPPCDPPPPCRCCALSALLIAHGAVMDWCLMRRVPLPPAPPSSGGRPIAPAPPSRPP
jgi:hypothetical protein